MTWTRKPDVLERIDPSRTANDAYCSLRVENKLIFTGKNDAAIRFLHDLENLIDQHIVEGDLTVTGVDGRKKHQVILFDDRFTVGANDLGDEDANIHLDVTPLLRVVGAQADEIAARISSLRSGKNNSQNIIRKTEG